MALDVERVKRHVRRDVVCRLASRQNGRVLRCTPSSLEKAGSKPRKAHAGNDGKVIYPCRENAEEAARFLSMDGQPQEAYPCTRDGHWHLRTTHGRRS